LRVFATKRFGVIIGDVINVLKLATVADYLTDGEIGNEQVLVKNNARNYSMILLLIISSVIMYKTEDFFLYIYVFFGKLFFLIIWN
tara:strand:- start:263 stop:520 length:258 start_codon:yes stop_codon:yes gene_type:complete